MEAHFGADRGTQGGAITINHREGCKESGDEYPA